MEPLTTAQESTRPRESSWTFTDTNWCLGIFGAAVGAGILFLPINAGIGGIWPLFVLAILLAPLTLIAHRGILRFCLAAKNPHSDFNEAANEHLGKTKGFWVTLVYFFMILPIVMAYSIGLTNTVESLIENQLNWPVPDRWLLSLVLMVVLVGVVTGGEKVILRGIATLVYPLGVILMIISVYLIPRWGLEQFSQPVTVEDFTKGFLSTLPILVFALAYVPMASAIAQSYRGRIKDSAQLKKKTELVLARGTGLLILMTLFFTFSCILAVSPESLMKAKEDNISIMTLFSLKTGNPLYAAVTSIVGITAISSSFIGFYLGAREGLSGLIRQAYSRSGKGAPQESRLNHAINIFYILILWLVGYLNWGVIDLMGIIAAPLMAIVLYLLPVYAARKVEALKPYRSKIDIVTVTVGVLCIGSYIVGAMM